METKFTFRLNHFLFMSKGWYQRSDTASTKRDLTLYKRVLELDGHSFITSLEEVAVILLRQFEEWNEWKRQNNLHYHSLVDIYLQVRDYKRLYDLTDETEAIIKFITSRFADIEGKYINFVTIPHYSRELFKKGLCYSMMLGNVKHGMTYKYQNDIAKEMFLKNK